MEWVAFENQMNKGLSSYISVRSKSIIFSKLFLNDNKLNDFKFVKVYHAKGYIGFEFLKERVGACLSLCGVSYGAKYILKSKYFGLGGVNAVFTPVKKSESFFYIDLNEHSKGSKDE